jgi:hypothetical protein
MAKEQFKGKVVTLEEGEETTEKEEEVIEEVIEEVVEEVVEEEKIEDPRKWFVRLYERNEPLAKDIFAGTLYYSELEDDIGIDTLAPQFASDIEGFMMGDIMVEDDEGKKIFISRHEAKKEWIQGLHKTTFGGDYYALEAEAVYETYET